MLNHYLKWAIIVQIQSRSYAQADLSRPETSLIIYCGKFSSLALKFPKMDESILKFVRKQEGGEITVATHREHACSEPVVAKTHSSRDPASKRNQDAQNQNSKSERPCEARRKTTPAAHITAMEGNREGRTISARLRNQELWEVFHSEETEMIITKAGRLVL